MRLGLGKIKNDPLPFQQEPMNTFPMLLSLARRLHSIPATTASVERTFSGGGEEVRGKFSQSDERIIRHCESKIFCLFVPCFTTVKFCGMALFEVYSCAPLIQEPFQWKEMIVFHHCIIETCDKIEYIIQLLEVIWKIYFKKLQGGTGQKSCCCGVL
jgi:hypothetical protein